MNIYFGGVGSGWGMGGVFDNILFFSIRPTHYFSDAVDLMILKGDCNQQCNIITTPSPLAKVFNVFVCDYIYMYYIHDVISIYVSWPECRSNARQHCP